MDVFALRSQLIRDYADYIASFVHVLDDRVREHVDRELAGGLLWPDPLLQLNPSFEPGAWIDDLADDGTLHPLCRTIFRLKPETEPDKPLRLHRHQADAVLAARSGDNYVVTTGTGSGKSLAYIIPIVDHVLRGGSGSGSSRGIQAIVVYPMNALANSQAIELEKFLCRGFASGQQPVTFRRYTGQESDAEREAIITHPPDILLTNYVMLELLLTRPRERNIVRAAHGLRFLVLDELHTYRGRQGADVALLVRRVRDACHSPAMQCVGTSATLAGGGTLAEQQTEIAAVASRLFGSPVKPGRVIGETLRRATTEQDLADPAFVAALTARLQDPERRPPAEWQTFLADPLSVWIESTFGLTREPETGRLLRATPVSITGQDGAARRLAHLTGVAEAHCVEAIEQALLAGYNVLHPDTGFPIFAFRLHQFLSRGDTVYASLEDPHDRYLTTSGQQFVPGDRQRTLLPLAFCRECGQEYYTVWQHQDLETGAIRFLPRDLADQVGEEDDETGFLYANPANPWPEDVEEKLARLPDDWLEVFRGTLRIKRDRQKRLPRQVWLAGDGTESEQGVEYHFVKSPFPFCLNCGVAYSSRQRSDLGKLSTLAAGGRSTATTVLSLSALRALRRDETLERKARKLLSFTDNRQDASLQAGHFNDFVEVGLLRAALYRAVCNAGPAGLTHEQLPQRVFEALDLPFDLYATDPTVKFLARQETERALREVLAYRVYHDLRRGWRVTAPNLEQCGLLQIRYASLAELCAAESEWQGCHQALVTATPGERAHVAQVLLDFLRRALALKVDYLDAGYQERIQQVSSQKLREPWAIDENESLTSSAIAFPRSLGRGDSRENVFVSGRSGLGLYLRRLGTFPSYDAKLSIDDAETIIRQLFAVLRVAGLVEVVQEAQDKDDVPGYQVPAAALMWQAGDGTEPFHDPIRVPRRSEAGARVNAFFVDFYTHVAANLQGIEAREHTAQVPGDEREERERRFREAELPVLFCSPTMELGVDISQLNAVNLRNVPPTPANYAQRSGRAGRSGQPALVFSYCTTGSPHDQYFFKRPGLMVAGSVAPPRLDLANEDLVRAHVHGVWLAETGMSLHRSLKDILDLSDPTTLDLLPSVRHDVQSAPARQRAYGRLESIFQTLQGELQDTDWYTADWLQKTLDRVEERFDRACDRWRGLYRSALKQREQQHRIIQDASRSAADKRQAKRLRAEAESQMELLIGGDDGRVFQSDFYSYRYFASEGFLPGYSFPRLPLSAFIPARGRRQGSRDEFLSRPRFLAISEFGPRSIVYHEGSRYVINQVILPVEDEELLTTQAKFCPACGYLHPIVNGQPGPDLCEFCSAPLGRPLRALFRMQNVSTKRRDRINSDEEERLRMGFDLKTGVRFLVHGDRPGHRSATVIAGGGSELLRLNYGHAATLWRINLGWRRRKDKERHGFVLDTERGYWARNQQAVEDDPEDPMSARTEWVVPFVEDHRNCLLVEPARPLPREVMASLQPALKNAIQVRYQLEDNELAAEPLPDEENRRFLLFYESAEGGAGVLRQLLDDPGALAEVAREALRVCHFDPETGADQRRAPGAREACEAACYDCLMSYTNQMDHQLLDRQLIRDLLLELSAGTVKASSTAVDRAEQLRCLKALCESDLEREWLDFLEEHNLRLPDEAQKLIEVCHTRCDFFYRDQSVAVFVDGPIHDQPDIAVQDHQVTACLEDVGCTVIRFGYQHTRWVLVCDEHSYLFGKKVISKPL
ncbi:MAG: DEAD/DEAH box helicase [Anaerolineae bacterium]|nr:DEAD/DEAH box helicase [Anaerolineae bacterium]